MSIVGGWLGAWMLTISDGGDTPFNGLGAKRSPHLDVISAHEDPLLLFKVQKGHHA